jgi:hypothetical protein
MHYQANKRSTSIDQQYLTDHQNNLSLHLARKYSTTKSNVNFQSTDFELEPVWNILDEDPEEKRVTRQSSADSDCYKLASKQFDGDHQEIFYKRV